MNPSQKLFLGQHIKIKSDHRPYFRFNRQMGTVAGFGEQGKIMIRPDDAPNQLIELYPHEIRDTDPPQEAPPHIKMAILKLA